MTSDGDDRVTGVSGVTIDITDLKEAEARRELLTREVDHRARNMLAVVQSIVHMTKAPSTGDFVKIVEGRIRALSIAHALLAESRWEGANLDQIISEELAPYCVGDAGRISVSGPQVFLKPATAQTIAMVVHELATNAAKYGALSEGKGKIKLAWEWRKGALKLSWQESGGPPVRPADTAGYGSKVIAASARQLGGTTRFDWRANGLHFEMSMTIGDVSVREKNGPSHMGIDFETPAQNSSLPEGGHILLVEDEAFVAMMMRDLIADFGFRVVGPFGTITDAMEALDRHQLVGAALTSICGRETHPGRATSGRGVPFVFVTAMRLMRLRIDLLACPCCKPVDGVASTCPRPRQGSFELIGPGRSYPTHAAICNQPTGITLTATSRRCRPDAKTTCPWGRRRRVAADRQHHMVLTGRGLLGGVEPDPAGFRPTPCENPRVQASAPASLASSARHGSQIAVDIGTRQAERSYAGNHNMRKSPGRPAPQRERHRWRGRCIVAPNS
jgi:two-component sensor histidine kinase